MDLCLIIFLFFFSQGLSYRTNSSRISGKGSSERKLKVLVPFYVTKKIGGQLAPIRPPVFSSKSSDQNFKLAILFSIVENPSNYGF